MLPRIVICLLLATVLWGERVHLVLKSGGRINERLLTAQGVRVLEPLGDGEWLVSVERSAPGFRLGLPLPGSKKLSEELRTRNIPSWAQVKLRGDEAAEVLVYFHKDVSADDAMGELDRLGTQFVERSDYFERVTAKVRLDDLEGLAALDWVRFVEPVFAPYKLASNQESGLQVQANVLQAEYGLDGSGAKVAVIDDPVATHPEFGSRLKQLQVGAGLIHGTHVAGTVGASGLNDPRLKGMAPAAQIISMPFTSVTAGIAANLNSKQNERVDVAQNSWTAAVSEDFGNCSLFGSYSSFDREMDRIVYNEKHPIVFAAGNERDSNGCLIPARAGYYSIPPPVSAKNLITVGAVDRGNAISEFSSFGPTRDGRVKPDIVALGVEVLSTSVRNGTATLSGTSMSAPAISGLSALLIDRFRSRSGAAPAPELLRALLLNTANDLGNPGPDYSYGYGIAQGVKALRSIDDSQWRTANVASGETREFEIQVDGGRPALRVMLAWTDIPAPAGRTRQLMNDLDLKLIGPDAKEYLPFVLDPTQPQLDAKPGENTIDNVEQVAVAQPAAGTWKVVVRAKELTASPQDFAFTWSTAENPAPPCSTTVTPSILQVSETSAVIPVQVARSSTCEAWSSKDAPDWIEASAPSFDKGPGVLKLRIAANDSGQQRRSTMQIAGRGVLVVQNTKCVGQAITSGNRVQASLESTDCLQEGSTLNYYTKVYTFEAKAGQRIVVEASSNSIDTYLLLFGPGNTMLGYDDDGGGGLNSRVPAAGSLVAPITGTYRILMTSALVGETGPFSLLLTLTENTDGTSTLPRVIEACPVTLDGELTQDSSRDGRRGDFYRTNAYLFEGRVGQTVKLSMLEAAFDGVLQLIGPTGATLANVDDSVGDLPRIESTLLLNGIYRVEVSSFSPFVTGRYKMEFTGCSEWSIR